MISNITMPAFFYSISSVKAKLKPLDFFNVLINAGCSNILISAYDIHHMSKSDKNNLNLSITKFKETPNNSLLLDSGNYESYWHNDSSWTSEKYNQVYKTILPNISFGYDLQSPEESTSKHSSNVANQLLSEQKCLGGNIIPIIHWNNGKYEDVIDKVVNAAPHIPMLGIPERCLGSGLIERCVSLNNIYKSVRKHNLPIHLLGTGNPISILLFSIFGAESFDGLEWCTTSVDHTSGLLFHFHQSDFFRGQTRAMDSTQIHFDYKTLLHNIIFYEKFLADIQNTKNINDKFDMLSYYLPESSKEFLKMIRDIEL